MGPVKGSPSRWAFRAARRRSRSTQFSAGMQRPSHRPSFSSPPCDAPLHGSRGEHRSLTHCHALLHRLPVCAGMPRARGLGMPRPKKRKVDPSPAEEEVVFDSGDSGDELSCGRVTCCSATGSQTRTRFRFEIVVVVAAVVVGEVLACSLAARRRCRRRRRCRCTPGHGLVPLPLQFFDC